MSEVGTTAPQVRTTAPEEMPRVVLTRRRIFLAVLFVAVTVAFLYVLLPRITGLEDTWNRIKKGDPWWLAGAALFECGSYLGYMLLFRGVFVREPSPIGWREAYQITMAGVAATRLFAAGGAGGIALQAWALRRSGLGARIVACRILAFNILLYAVYMVALVVDGLLLRTSLLHGDGDFAVTVIPAIFGAAVIAIFGLISLVPGGFERSARRWGEGRGRFARIAGRLATAPDIMARSTRTAIALIRARDPQLLGAVMWWVFDVATLWACFHAFGTAPPGGVIVMAYFVGTLGNLLPLPGGVGGVEGGMIGTFAAFGVPFGLATVAVLAYRGFSFWLPTIPGAIAYLQLRRTVARWDRQPAAGVTT